MGANMLAEPVIVGFTFAAAILIGISQLTFVFQVDVHGHDVIEKLITFFSHLGDAHALSIILAVCCMIFLLIIKYWMKGVIPIPGKQYAKFIPSALILWEIHEAEEWWDQKIGASNGGKKVMDKYNGNGALSEDETELLSDDGAADQGGVHGFTATHIANSIADDDGELRKQ